MGKLVLKSRHRLICGDAGDAAVVKRLMAGEAAGLCFTSPPYGQQRDYDAGGIGDWDVLMQRVFGCLPMAEAGQVLVNLGLIHKDGEWLPYWDGWIAWMRAQGWRRFGWYVWDQGHGLPGDWGGRLAPSHEFIWHFNKTSVQPEKIVPCNQKRQEKERAAAENGSRHLGLREKDGHVAEMTSMNAVGQTHKIPDSVIRLERHMANDIARLGHPATFPVSLPTFAIQCWPSKIVYDPFAGSGTTIIAAHQLDRDCRACELSPAYCDVAVARFEKLAGTKAVRWDV